MAQKAPDCAVKNCSLGALAGAAINGSAVPLCKGHLAKAKAKGHELVKLSTPKSKSNTGTLRTTPSAHSVTVTFLVNGGSLKSISDKVREAFPKANEIRVQGGVRK